MRWLEALFGHAPTPKARLETLFALATAQLTLQTTFGLQPTGRAGVVLRGVESSRFEAAEQELQELLRLAHPETGTEFSSQRDAYGFQWLVLEDQQLEDLLAATHLVGQTLQEHGFADRLLAGVFGFRDREGQRVLWIYNYKRATFYPFVPLGNGERRNNPQELRLAAVMGRELPTEPLRERWYALWGAPV